MIAVMGMLIVAVVAMVLVGVLAVVAVALAVKLLPFLLVGWVVVKLVQQAEKRPRGILSSADQRWLDSHA
jgi:hypothetical protein